MRVFCFVFVFVFDGVCLLLFVCCCLFVVVCLLLFVCCLFVVVCLLLFVCLFLFVVGCLFRAVPFLCMPPITGLGGSNRARLALGNRGVYDDSFLNEQFPFHHRLSASLRVQISLAASRKEAGVSAAVEL